MWNNPNLALIDTNAYTKFGDILSICSQDIEWKWSYEDGRTKWQTAQIQYSPLFQSGAILTDTDV